MKPFRIACLYEIQYNNSIAIMCCYSDQYRECLPDRNSMLHNHFSETFFFFFTIILE